MYRKILLGKIHRATVTEADVNYMGSITLDPILVEAAGFAPLEEVEVWNVTNGERFLTYCIPGKHGKGEVIVNGAAARRVQAGDIVIVAAYGFCDSDSFGPYTARVAIPDGQNRLAQKLAYRCNLADGSFEIVDEAITA